MILINIGDELLLGQVVNTNAAFIGQKFALEGMQISECLTIGDKAEDIEKALKSCFERDDIIIMTGGLGPTKDDITKNVISGFFNRKLVIDEATLEWVRELFAARGMELTDTNRKQAEVPEGTVILKNTLGTAPGMWIQEGEKVLIALPGVPFEAEKLIVEEVIPRLKELKNENESVFYRVMLCNGISESGLSDKLEDFEKGLPQNMKLAYLPVPGIIRLRLTLTGTKEEESILDEHFEKLKVAVGELAFAYEDIRIEEVIGNLLRKSGRRIATAESCTGGRIANLITSVPGSSEYFQGGVVAYNNRIKRDILSVREDNLKKHGAVSEMVVSDMALNVMELFDADYGVSTSGIAGPGGATEKKPVGDVWIAVATPTRLVTKEFNFGKHTNRAQIVERAANAALNMLRIEIEKDLKKWTTQR